MPRSYCPECHQLHDLEKHIHCPKMTRAEAIVSTCSTCATRTLLDEIQEALERAYNTDSSGWEKYQALDEVKSKLWEKKEPLLAAVRSAAENSKYDSCHERDIGEPECGSCLGCKQTAALRTLDPRLLGEL